MCPGAPSNVPSDPGRTSALVRPAAPSDADVVYDIRTATWRAAYRGMLPDSLLEGLGDPEGRVKWRAWLVEPKAVASGSYVAEVGGRAVGFLRWGPVRDASSAEPHVAELYALYVEASSWGTGAGFALHERLIADARAAGLESLTLWVLRANDRGRRFYERQGWRPDGATMEKPFRGCVLDEVRYRRAL